MKNRFFAVILVVLLAVLASAQVANHKRTVAQKGKIMTTQAKGTFEVKLAPQEDKDAEAGRMLIGKKFQGDLEAVSKGQMLSTFSKETGSGGYVAIEKVTGTLHGRKGSFILQHSSTMTRGVPQQSVTVVPDSGTDDLKGLTGKMTIIIADGKHSYEFEYTLPKAP